MSNNQPIHNIKLNGIQAAIWKNETSNGDMLTVTFKRSYKNKQGNYADTDSYTLDHLMALAEVIADAKQYLKSRN